MSKMTRPAATIDSAMDLSANATGTAYECQEMDYVTIQCTYSGSSPVGTLIVQGSLDGTSYDTIGSTRQGSNVTSVAIGTVTSPFLLIVQNFGFKYIRLSYAKTSGTGTLISKYSGRRQGM